MDIRKRLKFLNIATRDERGGALVVALLVVAVLALLGSVFLSTSRTENTIAMNDIKKTRAFLIAESGTEHARKSLEGLNLSSVLAGTTDVFPGGDTVNLGGGTYTVEVTNNYDGAGSDFPRGTIPEDSASGGCTPSATVDCDGIVVVNSTGNFLKTQQSVETILQITAFPMIPGGLALASEGVNAVDVDDDARVSGFDEGGTCADKPGLVWGGSSLSLDLEGTLQGAPNKRAYSNPPDDPIFGDPDLFRDLVNRWAGLPGVVTISGSNPPTTLGTAPNPQITVWNTPGLVTSSFTGYGILIVTDGIDLRGTFHFHGLFVVTSSDRVNIEGGADKKIHGALIVVSDSNGSNPAIRVNLEGDAQVLYNCDDIESYSRGAIPPPSVTLSWRQVF